MAYGSTAAPSIGPSTPFLATQKNAGLSFPVGTSTAGNGLNNPIQTINGGWGGWGGGPSGSVPTGKDIPAASGSPSGGGGGGFGSSAYDAAVATQSADYDRIMQGYRDLASSRINPQILDYHISPDVSGSLANLKNLSQTGGYSDADISNIRERSISPIRSIYANAQRNLDRNRTLSGGNTANYGALTSKMARESADQIGGITTNANAQIAQNVAQNKLSISPTWSAAAQSEQNARMGIEQHNQDVMNAMEQFNIGIKQNALGGQSSLYGTNPGLVDTFGRQALGAASLGQQGNSRQLELLKSLLAAAGQV